MYQRLIRRHSYTALMYIMQELIRMNMNDEAACVKDGLERYNLIRASKGEKAIPTHCEEVKLELTTPTYFREAVDDCLKLLRENHYSETVFRLKRDYTMYKDPYFVGYHKKLMERHLILGVDIGGNRACTAGWPRSITKISDYESLACSGSIKESEKVWVVTHYGQNFLQ